MKFDSAQDCLETYVYVVTSQGGPKGVTDDICIRVANLKRLAAKSDAFDSDEFVTGDNIIVTNVIGEPISHLKVNLHNDVDFSREDVIIFSIDIENILYRHFDDRERLALLVFGLYDLNHGAEALRGKTRYEDVRDFVEHWGDQLSPKTGGWSRVKMSGVVGKFERLVVDAGYVDRRTRLTPMGHIKPAYRATNTSKLRRVA